MFGPLPDGAQAGHLIRNPRPDVAIERIMLWRGLNEQYKLPKREYVFIYEMRELVEGRRWAPGIHEPTWERALAMCCPTSVDNARRRQAIKTSKTLDAREQASKLAYLLSVSGRPPLIKVRRGRYHSLVYITYCCMRADAANLTMWKIAPVLLEDDVIALNANQRLEQPYVVRMMLVKRDATQILRRLGMDTLTDTIYNMIYSTIQSSLVVNKMRLLQERYPESHRQHADYIDVDHHNIDYRLRKLRELSWMGVRTDEYANLTREQHTVMFNNIAWLCICFDPLFSLYHGDDFATTEGGDLLENGYDQYLEELNRIDVEHQRQLNIAWNESRRRQPREMRRRLQLAGVGEDNAGNDNNNGGGK